LIEVGWGGNLEAEAAVSAGESVAPLVTDLPAAGQSESPGEEMIEDHEGELPSEEMIEDHYAALQAWTEWAKNRGRASSPSATAASEQVERAAVLKAAMVPAEDERYAVEEFPAPSLRAELQHEHAPYSQLFSRLRQSK
jgi:general secretion pathway protein A